jgi:hypothetical protein
VRLAELPLDFVENRGQWNARTKFVARKGSAAAAFERAAMKLYVGKGSRAPLSLTFEGASSEARVVGEGARRGRYNFFLGDDPARWRAGVAAYESILYRGLYDGIDVRVRESAPQLEYDVLVAPGTTLGRVAVHAAGARSLELAPDGALLIRTAGARLRQAPPIAWEVLPGGRKRPLPSRVRILDDNRFGFAVSGRDPARPLVVDPGLDWATYLGGSGDETLEGLVLTSDGSGDIVAAGQSWSPDFPYSGGNLVPAGLTPYVARLNSTGTALVYATFFGGAGTGAHSVTDVAVNGAGQPVVVGDTNSVDFPTTPGAFDREGGHVSSGDYDAYVIKFNASGSGLVFGTYLAGSAGSGGDVANTVGYDPAGSVVVAGQSSAADFPRTAGAYPGQPGLFVTRFNPTGTDVTYSGFVGPGSVFDMVVDGQGFVTLTGQTANATFPTTPDAFDRTLGNQRDAIVARLKLDGGGAADLRYSTFLGGDEWIEAGNGIAIDPTNPELVTISGFTRSGDFPTTPGALLRTHFVPVEASMAYATRFRFPAGGPGSLVWSTFYGSPGNQTADDVAVDSTGAAILAGGTAVNNPATTERAYDRVPGFGHGAGFPQEGEDAYVARISADGSRLLYSTLLGGSSNEFAAEVEYAGGNSVVIGGLAHSTDFPVTPGAFDTVYAADGKPSDAATPGTTADDAFVARLTLEAEPTPDTTPPPAPEPQWPPVGSTYTAHHMGVAFDWNDVADASGIQAYHVQLSPNAEFRNDFQSEIEGWWEPWLPTSVMVKGFSISETGDWWWRVQALDRAGNLGPWSPVRTITVNDPAPPPAPVLQSPPNNGRFAPGDVTFAWEAAPRAKFYELQVDTSSSFSNANKTWIRAITTTRHTLSFTSERRYFWRVRGTNDSLSAGPWSTIWSFEIKKGSPQAPVPPPAPPASTAAPGTGGTALASLTLNQDVAFGAGTVQGTVTLTAAAPPEGAVIPLASNWPDNAVVPPSVTVPAGSTSAAFTVTTSSSTRFTQAYITGEYGGATQGYLINVYPEPTIQLNSFTVSTNTPLGGTAVTGTVKLLEGWTAGPGGARVALGSTNPALASVPPSVTIPAGGSSATFTITTQAVTQATNVTILASRSVTQPQTLQLLPPGALASLSINPKTVTGGELSEGTVTLAGAAPAGGVVVSLSSHDTTVATVPASVTVPDGASSATFTITTKTVCCQGHWSQITASSGGITKWETINVNPAPPGPQLSSLALSPTSVTGGSPSTGTVTLTDTVSACCAVVSLSSSNAAVAAVPASVTVPVGSSTAQFTVTTSSVAASTPVTVTGSRGVQRSAVLTVNPAGTPSPPPPPPPPPATDTVAIQLAEYADGRLKVEATSSSSSATMKVHVTSTNALIGTLTNDGGGRYRGEFNWPSNPQSITVRSSLGGSTTRTVIAK